MSETTETYFDVRCQCRCGRFVKESSVNEIDHYDPTAYFGIMTTVSYECGRCGKIDDQPRYIQVKEFAIDYE